MSQAARGAFWTWSLEHYQHDGAEHLLLRLQDEFQLNVNVLLWTCWCATRFEPLTEEIVSEALDLTGPWTANVTAQLRAARRYLKSPGDLATASEVLSLRDAIKNNELAAERIEQSVLEQLAADRLGSVSGDQTLCDTRVRHNLSTYAALTGVMDAPGFTTSLLESLAGHIFMGAPQSAVIGD